MEGLVPVLVGALSLFVVSLGFGVIVPLLPELTGAGASAASVLSVVYAVYSAAKIGTQIPAGSWVDAVGPRRVLNLGLLLFALSLLGFLFRGGILYFTLIRALEGFATGLVYPAVFSWGLRGSSNSNAGKRIGLCIALGTSGLLLGPALAGVLEPRGARLPVAVALLLTLLVLPVVLLQEPPPLERTGRPRTMRGELRGMGRLAANGAFFALLLPIGFNKLTFSSFQGLLPLYGPTFLGLSVRGVTFLFALTGVIFGVAQGVAGYLADRFSARKVVLALTPFLLGTLFAMAFLTQDVGFTLAYGGYIFSSAIIFTATMKYAARAFGTDDTYGGVFGVLTTLTDLMTIVGPLLFMNVYRFSARWVFLAMAVTGVPFALGFLHGAKELKLSKVVW
jgi:MFS family permease